MVYKLRYKYDRGEDQKVRIEPFLSEPEAVVRACAVMAEGTGWDFEVLTDNGDIVTGEEAIRKRCKGTRMP